MKKIVSFAAILLLLTSAFACGNENEAIEIPFTEYSLADTYCHWENLNYDNNVIVINSETELENYITCTEGTFPEIDFSEHTLLLASGCTGYGIQDLFKKLFFEENKYVLEIEITLNDATVVQGWKIALITDKLNDRSSVELNVITIKN